ncbi:hypothetical protein Ddc_07561 [Ditylenchus destructor]|nr:hypothetical protein Ddc_07561 [Ditylenchus destructor]
MFTAENDRVRRTPFTESESGLVRFPFSPSPFRTRKDSDSPMPSFKYKLIRLIFQVMEDVDELKNQQRNRTIEPQLSQWELRLQRRKPELTAIESQILKFSAICPQTSGCADLREDNPYVNISLSLLFGSFTSPRGRSGAARTTTGLACHKYDVRFGFRITDNTGFKKLAS